MLQAKNLPVKLWAEAINTPAYVLNHTGQSPVAGKSLFELWSKKEPLDICHLKIFGSDCYIHVPKQKRKKWNPKSVKGILVGYCDDKDGYRVYVPELNKVVSSRDVILASEKIIKSIELVELSLGEIEKPNESETLNRGKKSFNDEELNVSQELAEKSGEGMQNSVLLDEVDSVRELRDRSKINHPSHLQYATLAVTEAVDPVSFEQAMKSSEKKFWKLAADDEINSLHENDVLELVDCPKGNEIIGN